MRRDDRSRLEKLLEGVKEAPDAAVDGYRETMDKFGIIEIRRDGAPDPNDYPEDELDRYLFDLHEWALEQYRERIAELEQAATGIDVDEYPDLGVDRPQDRKARESHDEHIADAAAAIARVDEAREWLDKIEDEYDDH